MRLEASTAHICFWLPCCMQLCEKWLEEISDVTLAKVFPKVKCSNSSGTASLLTLRHGQEDCRKTSSLPHVVQRGWHLQMAWRLMGSRRVSLDSLEEGGVLWSPCASHAFSLYVRGFQAQVSCQCHSCGVGQLVKDGLQHLPLSVVGRNLQAVLFSWWVEARQGRDTGMLSITLPGNSTHCQGKPDFLSKGFGTELTSENESMKSSSRGT